MARVDTEISGSAPCPCGNGTIEYHYIDYDNPYSKADMSLRFHCANCEGRTLRNIGSTFSPRITVDGEVFIERMEIKTIR